jgi:hypothetical protein
LWVKKAWEICDKLVKDLLSRTSPVCSYASHVCNPTPPNALRYAILRWIWGRGRRGDWSLFVLATDLFLASRYRIYREFTLTMDWCRSCEGLCVAKGCSHVSSGTFVTVWCLLIVDVM